jgi:pteridine reductase
MTQSLVNTALITGASHRIGRALTLALAKKGFAAAVHCHSSEDAAVALVSELNEMGVRGVVVKGDLRDPKTPFVILNRAIETMGPIRYLINNAAEWLPDGIMTVDRDHLDAAVTLNAAAPLCLIRAFSRLSKHGAVLNLLDCRITDYDKKHAAYHISKRMLHDITRMTALELAPNIRVNGVAPGLILPPPTEEGDGYLKKRRNSNLLHRVGTLEAVTHAALFLLENRFITGQVLYVDGGRHLKGSVY